MAKWLFFRQTAILTLFTLCTDFKIFFCEMTSHWVLWNTYYKLFLKKCLWPCLGLSMSLSEWINWIIPSFPHRISKILFILDRRDHFGRLGSKIGNGFCHKYIDSETRGVQGCPLAFAQVLRISQLYSHLPNKRERNKHIITCLMYKRACISS